jgi:hypothetical protein
MAEALYQAGKANDLSCDSILCHFFEQASNKNLGIRPISKVLIVFKIVNS